MTHGRSPLLALGVLAAAALALAPAAPAVPAAPAAPAAPAGRPMALPGPDAGELWRYITETDPYTAWRPFPGLEQPLVQLDEQPHGDWVAVYANDVAVDSMFHPLEPFALRYGSILVKENYPASAAPPKDRSTMVALTVMSKVSGYHDLPGQEEWFWVMYTPGGAVATVANQPWVPQFKTFKGEVLAGKPWLCVHCHQGAAQSSREAVGDYVWKLKPFAPKP